MSPSAGPGIDYSPTPNPNAMKFTLEFRVGKPGGTSYTTRFDALGDPLGEALFEVPGVAGVFVMADFVTITKDPAAAWEEMIPALAAALRRVLDQQGGMDDA